MTKIDTSVEYNEDEELKLLKQFHAGDQTAMDKILNLNYKYISYVLKTKFRGYSKWHDDLFSEGFIGLRTAVERWKPDKHKGFKSYKFLWIRKLMSNFVDKEKRYVLADDFAEDWQTGSIFDRDPQPPRQENTAHSKILLEDAISGGILTSAESGVIQDYLKGYTHREIDERHFGGNRLSFFHFTNAKKKLVNLSEGKIMKKVNNNKVKAVESSRGRFFGLETKRGEKHNARLVGSSDHYLTIYDRNQGKTMRISKSNVKRVTIGGETF